MDLAVEKSNKRSQQRTVAILLCALEHAVADGHTGAARQHQQPPAAKLLVGLCHIMTTVTTIRTQVPTMRLSASYDGQLHLDHVVTQKTDIGRCIHLGVVQTNSAVDDGKRGRRQLVEHRVLQHRFHGRVRQHQQHALWRVAQEELQPDACMMMTLHWACGEAMQAV